MRTIALEIFIIVATTTSTLADPGFETKEPAFGSIRGTLRVKSKIQSRSIALSLYSRRSQASLSSAPPTTINEVENVVVYLEHNSKKRSDTSSGEVTIRRSSLGEPEERVLLSPSIRQIDETFVPHVLPILSGTTVDFPNFDPFFHNVFSLSGAKSFDLGRYPQGQHRSVRFDRPGIVKVFCHIHSHMSAVILVFAHPYFCMPDSQGRFKLLSVPLGNYTLVAWHERLKPKRQEVSVVEGKPLTLDLVL